MTEWTDEAVEQYARRVLLDALRLEWDDTGQEEAFTASKKYRREMREMAANPEAWYRKKAEPPWKRYARRLSAIAALLAVCVVAVWFLPEGGEAAAQVPGSPLSAIAAAAVALAAVIFAVDRKRKR